MSLRSEMLRDAKLILRDGLAKTDPTVPIDAKGYVADWRLNLLPGIDFVLIERDFRAGKGSELRRKFLAAHSSAALAVNVFGPFRNGSESFPIPDATLLYMYWEPADASGHELCRRHRDEIEDFAGRVAGGGPAFRAMSYPELWAAWSDAGDVGLRQPRGTAGHALRRFSGLV